LTSRSTRFVAPVALFAATIALRFGALLAPRALSLDDGTYGVSIADMREGLTPYHSLFSSQGPLFFPLLALGDAIGLHSQSAPRLVSVCSAVVVSIGTWAIARRFGSSPRVALIAGLLVATTGSMLWVTGPLTAEGPALAFTVAAVWVAAAYRDAPSTWLPWWCGVLLGAALATKPLMFPAVIVVAYLVRDHERAWLRVGAGAAGVVLTSSLWWGPARVWDQSIGFHLDKQANGTPWSHLAMIVTTLGTRDIVLVVAVGAGLVAALMPRTRTANPGPRGDTIVVAAWLAVLVLVLGFEHLLLAEHLSMLVVPLALLFALRPPPMRLLVAALALAAPLQIAQVDNIVWPGGYTGSAAQVVAALHHLPEDARAISDSPGLVWQAGLTTPPMLNDSSNARIAAHLETTRSVSAAALGAGTCAVVIWTFRFGENLPGLRAALHGDGYALTANYGHDQELWLRRPCVVPPDQ
jgi:hypothetical protein